MIPIFLTALLLCISYACTPLSWLVYIAIVPLFFLTEQKVDEPKSIGRLVFYSGFIYTLFAMSFLIVDHPQEGYGLSHFSLTLFLFFTWIVFSLINGIYFWGFGMLLRWRRSSLLSYSSLLIIPASYVLLEYARSWFVGYMAWAPNATMGPYWNYSSLGFIASGTHLVYLSRLMGMFGLSFSVILINLLIFWTLKRRFLIPAGVAIILVFGIYTSKLIYHDNGKKIEVAYLGMPDSNQNQTSEISHIISITSPNSVAIKLLVTPENGHFAELLKDKEIENEISRRLSPSSVIVSSGKVSSSKNLLTFSNQDGSLIYSQQKSFLIPLGEYVPMLYRWILDLINPYIEYRVTQALGLYPGPSETPVKIHDVVYGAVACSAIFAPEMFRTQSKLGAELLINSAQASIFGRSGLYDAHTLAMARYHAVANYRPYIQSSKAGKSVIVDKDGNIISRSSSSTYSFSSALVQAPSQITFYSRFGEVMIPFSLLILALSLMIQYKNIFKR